MEELCLTYCHYLHSPQLFACHMCLFNVTHITFLQTFAQPTAAHAHLPLSLPTPRRKLCAPASYKIIVFIFESALLPDYIRLPPITCSHKATTYHMLPYGYHLSHARIRLPPITCSHTATTYHMLPYGYHLSHAPIRLPSITCSYKATTYHMLPCCPAQRTFTDLLPYRIPLPAVQLYRSPRYHTTHLGRVHLAPSCAERAAV